MEYTPRLIDRYLSDLVATFPAVLVNGPRAAGKTTSARRLAASVVCLGRPAEAAGFLADPDAALRDRPEPLLLDEWQAVPGVLGAVKRSVDDGLRPGRFVLTGSVRADLEHNVWPGTGRLIRARMYGLAQREIVGGAALAGPSMLDKIAQRSADAFTLPATRPDLRDYIELAVRGGFPAAVLRTAPGSVDLWVNSYLEQLLTRDAQPVVAYRDSEKLVAYMHALSAMSAGIPEHKTVFDAAGVDAKTARTYDRLLEDLYIAEQIPALSTAHLQRLIKSAKRCVVDTSIMSASFGAGVDTILGSDDLLGPVIDTFVMAQLRPEIAISRQRTRLYHARAKGGREEVDTVAELPSGTARAIRRWRGAAHRARRDRTGRRHLRRTHLRVLGVSGVLPAVRGCRYPREPSATKLPDYFGGGIGTLPASVESVSKCSRPASGR